MEPLEHPCHDMGVLMGDVMMAACAGGDGFDVFSLGGAAGGSLEDPEHLYHVMEPGVTIGHSAGFTWDGEVIVFGHEPGGRVAAECGAHDPDLEHTYFFYDSATGDKVGEWTPEEAVGARELHAAQLQRGAAPERALRARARELPVRDERRRLHGSGERGRARLERSPAAAQAPDVAVLLRGRRSLVLVLVQQLHLRDEHHDGLNIFRFSGSQTGGAVLRGHSNPLTQVYTIG
jgi:hypothetical protein